MKPFLPILLLDPAGAMGLRRHRRWPAGGIALGGCTSRVERQTNPLGPFQPAGERAGSLLLD